MKDKTTLVVLIVVLGFCLIALLCLGVFAFIFPLSFTRSITSPSPYSSLLPNAPSNTSHPSETSSMLSVLVSPERLVEGAEAHVHVRLTNPGRLDLEGYTLLVGYGGENNLINIINIQTISLTSEVGELFEEDIIWRVDYVPDDQKYRVVLSLLKPDSSILDETSVAVEFVKPTMVISMTPNQLTSNSAAVIHIQVNNPSGADMHDYKLLIGYAAKEDPGMYSIGDVPLSLAAGGTFEKDIGWNERFVPSSGEFELRMILLLPDGTVFIETTTPFTFNGE